MNEFLPEIVFLDLGFQIRSPFASLVELAVWFGPRNKCARARQPERSRSRKSLS